MNQYEEYLQMPERLEFQEMQKIHRDMLSEIGTDENAVDLYKRLLDKAIDYTGIRAGWSMLEREEKMERDAARTSLHNLVISHFDKLAQYLRILGKPAAWRDALGYVEEDPYNRKRIGDMANYLVFAEAVTHR